MKSRNMVIGGDYETLEIEKYYDKEMLRICYRIDLPINKDTVLNYQLINQENNSNNSDKVKRGLLGGLIGGTVGAIVGSSSTKQNNIYTIAVNFKNGRRSLIEIDDKLYKVFITSLF